MFGQNPRLPSVLDADLPACEATTSSQMVADHINALHKARESYMQAEASSRIKKALKANIRNTGGPFLSGDRVFYKRDNDKWRGPASVIGSDSSQVFVRHGGIVVRVHPVHLRHAKRNDSLSMESQSESNVESGMQQNAMQQFLDDESDDSINEVSTIPTNSGSTVVLQRPSNTDNVSGLIAGSTSANTNGESEVRGPESAPFDQCSNNDLSFDVSGIINPKVSDVV